MPGRVVPPNRDVLLSEDARLDNASVGQGSVGRGESAVEADMCALQEYAGQGFRFGRMRGFQLSLSIDVRDGDPLPLPEAAPAVDPNAPANPHTHPNLPQPPVSAGDGAERGIETPAVDAVPA